MWPIVLVCALSCANSNTPSADPGPSAGPRELRENWFEEIERQWPQLQECYDERLLDVPGLKGTWRVKFVVELDGTTGQIDVKGKDEVVSKCIETTIGGWSFRPTEKALPVSRRISFQP